MNLLTATNLHHSFGDQAVLDHASLSIESDERVCLVGRNGTGKSTLLKILARQLTVDQGQIVYAKDIRISTLRQTVPESLNSSVYDCVARGIGSLAEVFSQWHRAALAASTDASALARMQKLQDRIEADNAWNLEHRISSVISKLGLAAEAEFDHLSGGMKRRVLLGQALVAEPDLLLLDEPTNHLDIESILWLEGFLRQFKGSLIFITHDRSFLQSLSTRILDLDRGQLTSWPGSYTHYTSAKQALLDNEMTQNALFDQKLAAEEVWIRQGIKARRTRNEGRVRALQVLRETRARRRTPGGKAQFIVQAADISGTMVIEAENISFSHAQKPLIENFSCRILRGEKIGIIGSNGCGKSTLIQLLLGQIKPQSGTVKLGSKLGIAYFDQQRKTLNLEKSVRENIGCGGDQVMINGRSKHVISYLKHFLFTEKQIHMPAKALSGGERNRLLLAQLFSRSFNLLVMDEPTNDLDMDTLDLLEEMLTEFQGSLILVSHDRWLIDNIVTSTFVFETPGQVTEYVGGYEDWLRQRPAISTPTTPIETKTTKTNAAARLNRQQQKELQALPQKIEKLEARISALEKSFAQPGFFQQDAVIVQNSQQALQDHEAAIRALYQRWQELES